MKIAYIIKSLSIIGGIERILLDKANALVARGLDVYIVVLGKRDMPFYSIDERVKLQFLDVESNKFDDLKLHISLLDKVINDIKPDITITPNDGLMHVIGKLSDGSEKIIEYHTAKDNQFIDLKQHYKVVTYPYWWMRYKLESMKLIRSARRVDKLVVLTHEDLPNWQRELSNVVVIPNFTTFQSDDLSSCSTRRVIAVGRLCHQKRFDYLISAWGIVAKRFPDWVLSIYGRGHLEGKLRKQIDILGLQGKVILEGVTQNVGQEYAKSSIYALSSAYEGFGIVLIEAMRYGLPTVGFACPCGPRDIINHNETGILVDRVGDVEGLANGLMKLMESEELRRAMGQKGLERAQIFSEEKVIDKWMALFEELISNKCK